MAPLAPRRLLLLAASSSLAPTQTIPRQAWTSLETKRLSVFAHASQNPGVMWEHHQVMHRVRGLETLTTAAESFVHHRPSPTSDLLDPLAPRPR